MNYELVNVNLHANRLSEILGIHNNEGYIIIGAFLTDANGVLNFQKRRERTELLRTEIKASGHGFAPAWGKLVENEGTANERKITEQAFIVLSLPFSYETRFYDAESVKELGTIWCRRYEQDFFLYKPRGGSRKAYCLDRDGEFIKEDEEVIKELVVSNVFNPPLTRYAQLKLYFSEIAESRSSAGNNSYKFTGDLFMAQAPEGVEEAKARFGELFYRW